MIEAAIAAAVERCVGPLVAELRALREQLAEIVSRGDELLPLATILGISTAAAAARIRRDPGLAALGVLSGRRWLFRRADVERYLRRGRGR